MSLPPIDRHSLLYHCLLYFDLINNPHATHSVFSNQSIPSVRQSTLPNTFISRDQRHWLHRGTTKRLPFALRLWRTEKPLLLCSLPRVTPTDTFGTAGPTLISFVRSVITLK
jgi:hypothetical protein